MARPTVTPTAPAFTAAGRTIASPPPYVAPINQVAYTAPQLMQRMRIRAERNVTTGRLASIISAAGNFVFVEQITPIFELSTDVGLTKAIYLRPNSAPAVAVENAPRLYRFANDFSEIQVDSEPGNAPCFIDLVIGFGAYENPSQALRVEPFWTDQTITRPANITPYAANQIVGPQPAVAYGLLFQNVFGFGRRYARITRARVQKSSLTTANAQFSLHIWQGNGNAAQLSTADQAVFTLKADAAVSYLGRIQFPVFYTGGAGSDMAVAELNGLDLTIMNPDRLYAGIPLGPYTNISGLLVADAAYVPASGETLLIELFGERF